MRLSCQAINISSFRVLSGGWRLFSCRLHFKVGLRMMVAGCDPISCPQLIRSRYPPPPPAHLTSSSSAPEKMTSRYEEPPGSKDTLRAESWHKALL